MGTPFGKPAITFDSNGIEYQKMAEMALAKLHSRMNDTEFKAWQYRAFDSKGMAMDKWDWRTVWMMAANEAMYPTVCECGGDPDRANLCRLCQSIKRVSDVIPY